MRGEVMGGEMRGDARGRWGDARRCKRGAGRGARGEGRGRFQATPFLEPRGEVTGGVAAYCVLLRHRTARSLGSRLA